ncbi:hypothetical protein ACFL38_02105 [Candidatus Omnitrophota bacterium]
MRKILAIFTLTIGIVIVTLNVYAQSKEDRREAERECAQWAERQSGYSEAQYREEMKVIQTEKDEISRELYDVAEQKRNCLSQNDQEFCNSTWEPRVDRLLKDQLQKSDLLRKLNEKINRTLDYKLDCLEKKGFGGLKQLMQKAEGIGRGREACEQRAAQETGFDQAEYELEMSKMSQRSLAGERSQEFFAEIDALNRRASEYQEAVNACMRKKGLGDPDKLLMESFQ